MEDHGQIGRKGLDNAAVGRKIKCKWQSGRAAVVGMLFISDSQRN